MVANHQHRSGWGSYYLPNNTFAFKAAFYNPLAVAADVNKNGNYYIADCNPSGGYGAVIYKVTSSGIITILAGTGSAGYTGDGGAATSATFSNQVNSIAVDLSGNVYISDSAYSVIRKVLASNGTISTVAGSNPSKALFGGGYNGDGIAATSAFLHGPYGITVDSSNNLYIVDTYNYRVRKVTFSTGLISTIAGNGTQDPTGKIGNGGPATSAELADPTGVAEDQYGDIYFVDNPTNGSNSVVRKVSGSKGTLGQLPNVLIARSYNLAVDPSYNLYITDSSQILEYNPVAGTSKLVAGTGSAGFSGDGGPAKSAELNLPQGLAVDISGNIYIADTANQRIRQF